MMHVAFHHLNGQIKIISLSEPSQEPFQKWIQQNKFFLYHMCDYSIYEAQPVLIVIDHTEHAFKGQVTIIYYYHMSKVNYLNFTN